MCGLPTAACWMTQRCTSSQRMALVSHTAPPQTSGLPQVMRHTPKNAPALASAFGTALSALS